MNIGNRLASSIPSTSINFSQYLKSPNLYSFAYHNTCAAEIIDIVSSFKSKWSSGCDGIPINIVKSSILYLAEPLSRLINSSFLSEIFPDSLKIGKVSLKMMKKVYFQIIGLFQFCQASLKFMKSSPSKTYVIP